LHDFVGTWRDLKSNLRLVHARLHLRINLCQHGPSTRLSMTEHADVTAPSGSASALASARSLALGAGGMKTYPLHLLTEFRRVTSRWNLLLIADEVMTGWGEPARSSPASRQGFRPTSCVRQKD